MIRSIRICLRRSRTQAQEHSFKGVLKISFFWLKIKTGVDISLQPNVLAGDCSCFLFCFFLFQKQIYQLGQLADLKGRLESSIRLQRLAGGSLARGIRTTQPEDRAVSARRSERKPIPKPFCIRLSICSAEDASISGTGENPDFDKKNDKIQRIRHSFPVL